MACGTCKKKTLKKSKGVEIGEKQTTPILKEIGIFVLSVLVGILALPVLFSVLVYGLYQGWAGDGFDLTQLVNFVKKKKEPEAEEEEINPDDYELMGVEKIEE